MKQVINEVYQAPMSKELRSHILNDLGLSKDDQTILISLMDHNAESDFHYDNTGIGRGKFERRLNGINRVVFPELIRLSSLQLRS